MSEGEFPLVEFPEYVDLERAREMAARAVLLPLPPHNNRLASRKPKPICPGTNKPPEGQIELKPSRFAAGEFGGTFVTTCGRCGTVFSLSLRRHRTNGPDSIVWTAKI